MIIEMRIILIYELYGHKKIMQANNVKKLSNIEYENAIIFNTR